MLNSKAHDQAVQASDEPNRGAPADGAHRSLRTALGTFATGITIVTGSSPRGEPVGLTVNSFSSVSLDPPLVSWSLRGNSGLVGSFDVGRRCAIHVLSAAQESLARHFASPGIDRFAAVKWHADRNGVPVLDGSLARFDCRTVAAYEAGDHRLLLARIDHHATAPGTPLLFAGGRYRVL